MISPLLSEVVAGRAPELMTFTVDQYHQLTQSGVLLEGAPVELIDGVIVCKDRRDGEGSTMNHGPNHGFVVSELFEILRSQLHVATHHVRNQLPVTLTDCTEPEPDLAVVVGMRADYLKRHPGPADIRAVIEVADSSRNYDRTTKQRIYASANIPTYWVVNLPENRLETFRQPDPKAGIYQALAVVDAEGTAELMIETDEVLSVPMTSLFPPA
ncbi:hypothetical protein Pan258_55150 [Symmachiella dynata]|uniref:Uma2 family endonuclease n=1 Tax=Symmachiella dynata TaxID=2527995 RepID=UPI001189C5BB|nr:Uma2 family endonuclease [Symmachiella dynata]QDT51426.1 hypothetical protein Pan258_55150 [Symmachiella dynata]